MSLDRAMATSPAALPLKVRFHGWGTGLVLLAAWRQSKRRMKAREQATSYVVEQLRRQEPPAAVASPLAAAPALDSGTSELRMAARDEIAALVEKQPEEVAQLLRGWLVEADR